MKIGFWGDGQLFYYHEKSLEIGIEDPLVIYWSLEKSVFWARPEHMWSEEVKPGVKRFTAIKS